MRSNLTKEFNPTSSAAWKQKIQVDLKGADYNDTLITQTNEGIAIKPFYHLDTFEKLDIPTDERDFRICQKLLIISEKETNKIAIESVDKGVSAIKFLAFKPFNVHVLFNGLLNKNLEFHFHFEFLSSTTLQELSDVLKDETVFYNFDCIGNLASSGNWYNSHKEDFSILKSFLGISKSNSVLGVNADIYQNAGANIVQQVAYALAHGAEYLEYFGVKAANDIQFNISVGGHYFFEIAKIRALRYLWKLILDDYMTSSEINIYAEPSLRNKTLFDYNVNILRTTTEGMSAVLGGVNTFANSSYDVLFHEPNEFGNRVARNQLLILKEESYFKQPQFMVTNSYYIESITKQITEKALHLFKNIEKSGGLLKQLMEGTIQRKIVENAKKEQTQFDKGQIVLLGTNKYPNPKDEMKKDLQKDPFSKKNPIKTVIVPIRSKRLAESLELKRLKDEA